MNNKIYTNSIFVFLVALFCCALWGLSVPVIKFGYTQINFNHIPTLLLWAGLQFVCAGIVTVILYSIKSKRFLLPQKKNVFGIISIGFFQTFLQYTLSYIGLANTTAVKGTILKGSDVFFCLLVSSLIFRYEKLNLRKIIACVIGFTGLIIANLNGLKFDINFFGDVFVILSTFSYALSVGIAKKYSKSESPILISGYAMLFGGTVMTTVGFTLKGNFDFYKNIFIIIALAAIFTVSYALWGMLVKYNSISKLSLFGFTVPIFGVVFSYIILVEESNISFVNLIIALVLISIGIIICNTNSRKDKQNVQIRN